MADNNDDYHIYIEPEKSELSNSKKSNENEPTLSNSRKGIRRPSLSIPKDIDVKGSFKNAKENTMNNLHQGADTFVEDMQDMPMGCWRACVDDFWLFKILFFPICLTLKKSPNQLYCCGCRVWSKEDAFTVKGLALFLLSGGCVAFTFFVIFIIFVLISAAIFFAIEPSAFKEVYRNAIYFTIITFTTIGYGDITLKCTGSRMLEFFFVLFGIPMGAVSLTMVGSQLWKCMKIKKPREDDAKCIRKMRQCGSKVPWILFAVGWVSILLISSAVFSQLSAAVANIPPDPNATVYVPPNVTCQSIFDTIFDPIASLVKNENATLPFADAFYFTWVTLSTIGYGDYYQTSQNGIVLVCMLALVGVGYFTLIVSKCGVWVEKCFDKRFKDILKRFRIHQEEKDIELKEKEKEKELEELEEERVKDI